MKFLLPHSLAFDRRGFIVFVFLLTFKCKFHDNVAKGFAFVVYVLLFKALH